MAEVGKGITKMSNGKARNLAILLENQARYMSKMNEAVLASQFNGYTPKLSWVA